MARYIDADRLISEISGNGGVFVYGVKAVMAIVLRINAQRTADVVEVRHGEWHYCKNGGFKCTACGGWTDDYYGASPKYMSYCPKCGAKMDGGKNENLQKN